MFVTMDIIIDSVLVELGLVPGSGVQTYTEPQIVTQIQTEFIALAEKRFWSHMMRNTLHNLDGAAGVVTTALENIRQYEDIEWIRYYPYEKWQTIEKLQGRLHMDGMREGYERIHYSDAMANKLFRVYPITFNVPIMVRARRWPDFPLNSSSFIPFDQIALQHMVASNLLAKDGINPMEAARQYAKFEARYADIISNEEGTISRYGRNNNEYFTVAEEE